MSNKSSCWLAMWRLLHTSRAAALLAALILTLLTVTRALGQEQPFPTSGLTEADALMKDGKYEEARNTLDFRNHIYEAQRSENSLRLRLRIGKGVSTYPWNVRRLRWAARC